MTPKPRRAPAADALREKAKQQQAAELETGQGALLSFDAVAATASAEAATAHTASPSDLLVEALRASDIMEAQLASLPRSEPFEGIASAVRALVEAHGVLPVTVVAERAGKRAARASGFAATLQRVLNYDQAEVLTLTDNGRSLRLDLPLLRRQFGLDETQGGRRKR